MLSFSPNLGSAEGGHPDFFRFPRFLPICSDLRSLFAGMPRFVPICSDFFRFVFRTNQNKLGKPLSADPFCKSPTIASPEKMGKSKELLRNYCATIASPEKMSREGFCRNPRGIFLNKVSGEFCGGFFGGFFKPFSLEKQEEKIHPKIHGNFQIRIWEFQGQNPHCKDPALKKWESPKKDGRVQIGKPPYLNPSPPV